MRVKSVRTTRLKLIYSVKALYYTLDLYVRLNANPTPVLRPI